MGGVLTRIVVVKNKGIGYFENTFVHKFDNATTVGLLLTLVLIFASQTEVILSNPLHIVLIAVPLTVQTGVFAVKPITNAYTAHFMFYVLESSVFKDFLQQLSAGSTINHLYQKDLVKFDLYVPPTTEEQETITGILFDMDLDIYKLEEKLSKYQKIKQGMMEELLTGKVRLV